MIPARSGPFSCRPTTSRSGTRRRATLNATGSHRHMIRLLGVSKPAAHEPFQDAQVVDRRSVAEANDRRLQLPERQHGAAVLLPILAERPRREEQPRLARAD